MYVNDNRGDSNLERWLKTRRSLQCLLTPERFLTTICSALVRHTCLPVDIVLAQYCRITTSFQKKY